VYLWETEVIGWQDLLWWVGRLTISKTSMTIRIL
jgi:hypothetical protein